MYIPKRVLSPIVLIKYYVSMRAPTTRYIIYCAAAVPTLCSSIMFFNEV